jgi:hypothetical protein
VGADVRGHDDDRVLEVDGAPLGVGRPAVVQDLEKHVEDVVVSLFDLVEENDGVGLLALKVEPARRRRSQAPPIYPAKSARYAKLCGYSRSAVSRTPAIARAERRRQPA